MKPSNSSAGTYKPFKKLKSLLESKSVELQPAPSPDSKGSQAIPADPRPEHRIFKDAMADVKRISRTQCIPLSPLPPDTPSTDVNSDLESVTQLKNLVKYGTGFIVSLTPEYQDTLPLGRKTDTFRLIWG